MKISIGIVGCGTHAQHHARTYMEHFVTQGIFDPSPEAMKKMNLDCTHYGTFEEMLSSDQIQAVMICSPDQYHLEQIQMALHAGKHVFCEKPLLVPEQSLVELERIFYLASSKGLVLTSCHPRRFDRAPMWFKKQITKGGDLETRFGKVIGFDFDFSYHAPSNDWKHSRSLLLDHVNHEVDLMNFFFGIQPFYGWKIRDGFDHYEVVGKRDDGISFHFNGTRRLDTKNYPEWCRIRFEKGEVTLDMMMGAAFISDHEKKILVSVGELSIDYEGRLHAVMKDFADQITTGKQGYLSPSEMLMNTESGIVLQEDGMQRISVR